jgi:dTDP-4-amino-4,6-dideoxygalactose transaminase
VREFEAKFATKVGAADAVATTSCTTALQLALYASGVGPGDEVVVPSLSFIASANAVWHCGAQPVFADIDPLTYNLDPVAAERAITPRTRAIMPVHQVGLPADMDAFLKLGARHASRSWKTPPARSGQATRVARSVHSVRPLASPFIHAR